MNAVTSLPTGLRRILFVSANYPADFDKAVHGVFLRMRLFVETLHELAPNLDVLFFARPDLVNESSRASLEQKLREKWGVNAHVMLAPYGADAPARDFYNYYVSPALRHWRDGDYEHLAGAAQCDALRACLKKDTDLVFVHRLPAMSPVLLHPIHTPTLIFDLDDIEHRKLRRQLALLPAGPHKLLSHLRLPALMWAERLAIRRAAMTFVCSSNDRDYLRRRFATDTVVEIPNVASFPAQISPPAQTQTLLFIGSFTYTANANAAEHLIRKIWPHIKAACSTAELIIAGNKPELIPSYLAALDGVRFTGFVEDLEPLYAQTRVVCCPILMGGGTRIKIIEAAGYGRAVVSTHVGAEGLEFDPPDEILLEDDPKRFAEHCVRLLNTPDAERVGIKARAKALACYDRAAVIQRIRHSVLKAVKATPVDRSLANVPTTASHGR
ncbi:MAG TPA: glycosyltransferase [Burkholderiales bacterium]|nr:glycosyltransferase [Burkholderiales bacterium]